MGKWEAKAETRERRKAHIRKLVTGTPERPRLSVFRSVKHIFCQVIDDIAGRTLAAAGSQSPALAEKLKHGGDVKAAVEVGKLIAEEAKKKGITKVVFDRSSYRYHGRIKALADAARKAGLKF